MADWVTCPACNLKHTARSDGSCPRCKASVTGTASATPGATTTAGPVQVMAPPPVERRPAPAVAVLEHPPDPSPGAPAIVPGTSAMASLPGRTTSAVAPAADLVYLHEPPLFAIVLSISILFWILLLVGTLGMALVYAPFVFVGYLFAQSGLIAYLKGTAIRITPSQFPDLHARLTACAERLGLSRAPDCYLLNGQGGFNAFATRFLGRDFVVLFSDVVDALEERPGAVDFYLGHEMAHIHRGHLRWRPVLLPGSLLPLLGAAYHRACESTCDRYGAACCSDPGDAAAAITALAAGEKRWKTLSVDDYVAQAGQSGGFWMSFHELVSDYPWLVKRVARVVAFRDGQPAALPARNPLAYLFAMFVPRAVGGAAGGLISLLVVVAVIGIIAAIAIPSLLHARIAANEAAAVAEMRTVSAAEASYRARYGGFGSLACLAARPQCVGRPATPELLSPAVATTQIRRGYRFTLELPARGDGFVYLAVPQVANETGRRSFCTDSSGAVFAAGPAAEMTDPEGTSCSRALSPIAAVGAI